MKRSLILLLLLIVRCLPVFCQDIYSAKLPVSGWVTELGVSPSEEIWMATKAGNVYFTKQIGNTWGIGPYGSLRGFADIGDTFERINFFSENTMMISGFIQTGGSPNFVYWSGNHGKTWQKVTFGINSWVDAAYINNNGKAWMSGSSQLIYFTSNGGKTWQSFDKVEPTGNLRFQTVHFAKDEVTGLFGSTWNVIYKTTDNCKTWAKIPTPLTQKKYKRINSNDRPEIVKVRILGNHYIVKQENKVFITESNNIDWKYLPNAYDFEITEQDQLYVVNKKRSVDLFDSQLNKIWTLADSLNRAPAALAVRNGKLFAYDGDKIYKISPKEFIASELLTNEIPIPEPNLKLTFNSEGYGFKDKDTLKFDKDKKRWYRFISVNFDIAHASLLGKDLIITDYNLSNYDRIDVEKKLLSKFSLPNNLYNPAQIVEMHFERGYQGCFNSDNSIRSYTKQGQQFVLNTKKSTPNYLVNVKRTFNEDEVFELAGTLDNTRQSKTIFSDLNLSDADISGFKKFIDEKKKSKKSDIPDFSNIYDFPGDKIDFDFYKKVADSLFSAPALGINDVFLQPERFFSTTTVWNRVIFVFKNGEKLIAENSDYKPNYLLTPWIVTYNDLKFKNTSIKFGQKVDKITSGDFFEKSEANKKQYALFKIADYLYRQKLSKEDL